jgi:hypothetical protein
MYIVDPPSSSRRCNTISYKLKKPPVGRGSNSREKMFFSRDALPGMERFFVKSLI